MIDLTKAKKGYPAQITGTGSDDTVTVYILPITGNLAYQLKGFSPAGGPDADTGVVPLSSIEKVSKAMAGTILVGWDPGSFSTEDGPLEYSEEAAEAVMSVPWIANQIAFEAHKLDEQRAAERTAAVKKSKGHSTGSSSGARKSTGSRKRPRSGTVSSS